MHTNAHELPRFDTPGLLRILESSSDEEIDSLSFGVIGFGSDGVVSRYNLPEAKWAALDRDSVLGTPMFEVVAPCMNNYLIAERLVLAGEQASELDETLDYVLTLRMKPTPVKLRLLSSPTANTCYILVLRK